MSNCYYHQDDFDCDDVPELIMPNDIKRIASHGKHTFHKRFYFFSPSQRQVYEYNTYAKIAYTLKGYEIGNSLKFNIVSDRSRHDSIYVSERMIDLVSNMSKIELPKLR